MWKWLSGGWHYLVSLAVVASVSALCAVGRVSGDVAVPVITGIGSALGVGGLVGKAGTTSGGSGSTPA